VIGRRVPVRGGEAKGTRGRQRGRVEELRRRSGSKRQAERRTGAEHDDLEVVGEVGHGVRSESETVGGGWRKGGRGSTGSGRGRERAALKATGTSSFAAEPAAETVARWPSPL
jgi:hypothetical protein